MARAWTVQYQSAVGMLSCISCSPGMFQALRHGTSCSDCPAGKCERNNRCILCPRETFTRAPRSSQCEHCELGWGNSSEHTRCAPSCCAGMFLLPNDTGSHIGTCSGCEVGQYQPAAWMLSCMSCDPGMFQQLTHGIACSDCPAGKFQDASGQKDCPTCLGKLILAQDNLSAASFTNRTIDCLCPPSFERSMYLVNSSQQLLLRGQNNKTRPADLEQVVTCCPGGFHGQACGCQNGCSCTFEDCVCAKGARGPGCTCESGSFPYRSHCLKCPPLSISIALVSIMFRLFAALILRFGHSTSHSAMGSLATPAAIGLHRIQISLQILLIHFKFPAFLVEVLRWISDRKYFTCSLNPACDPFQSLLALDGELTLMLSPSQL